jgi:[ribosomal protein S18]-alanine N-acetyltransferase
MKIAATISNAGHSDLADILSVMMRAFDPEYGEAWSLSQLQATLSLPGMILLRADVEDCIAGFCLVRSIKDEAELLLIAVDPEFARAGIGRTLINTMLAELKERETSKIFLEVRAGNQAVLLYQDVGFVQIGSRPRYYRGLSGSYYDAQTFQLPIK